MDLSRFSFGINLDDPWRYAGVPEPRSVLFPHVPWTPPRASSGWSIEAKSAVLSLADDLRASKVDFVRCWFPWRYFEPSPVPRELLPRMLDAGYPDWPMDGLVSVLGERGIEVIPVLACGYRRLLPEGLSPSSGRGEYVKRAYLHARLVVRHYKDRVRAWQIENEPNWWHMHELGGWRSGAWWLRSDGFGEALLGALNRAVHEEDPSAVTFINLEGDQRGLRASRFAGLCDFLGLDFYPNYAVSSPLNVGVFRRARDLAREAGNPVCILETGYPSAPSFLRYSEARQADYVEMALRTAHGMEGVAAVGIWRYIDTGWRSFPGQENHFGLVDERKGPKPAWLRFGQVSKSLRG